MSAMFAKGISALASNSLMLAIKKYMLAGKLLNHPNNICILRDLIDTVNRLLVHQYEVIQRLTSDEPQLPHGVDD